MFTFHRTPAAVVFSLFSFLVAQVDANVVRISAPPPPQEADTEVMREFEPPIWKSLQNEFFITISFDANASNNLEVAFWDSAAGSVESASVIGWDCGAVFISDAFKRAVSDFAPDATSLTISVSVELFDDGGTRSVSVSANGEALEFFDSKGEVTDFVFSSEWNAAQVVSRGFGARSGSIAMGFSKEPNIILIR